MNFDGDSGVFVDPWQEYKSISVKLKKRFLRKPNLAEASRSFVALSHRLTDEGCYHYAGFCQLAVARCEHTIANIAGEVAGLREAGRMFGRAESDMADLGLPSFGEHMTTGMHCYGHAIRVHLEHNEIVLAGELCLELGQLLYALGRLDESFDQFERASRLLRELPTGRLATYRWLIRISVESGQYIRALDFVTGLDGFVKTISGGSDSAGGPHHHIYQLSRMGGGSHQAAGLYPDTLSYAEVMTVMLLLCCEFLPKHLKPEHSGLLARYTQVSTSPGGAFPESNIASLDLQLLLHSFALAVSEKDARSAELTLKDMWPQLNMVERTLGVTICQQKC